MSPERWHRVEELYHSALEKSPDERAPFLADACVYDVALRRQVEALILRTQSPESPLDDLPWKLLESTELRSGATVGPYRILHLVGSGGMGRVYKAIDTRLDRTVAIKISKSQFSERFRREARAISALSHPNICTLYDVGPDYLVMEFIQGTPIKGPLPVRKALPIAIAVAGALDAAHRGGVIHCDLKPANVLLSRSGPKLLDFGLALQDTAPDDREAQPGEIAGTLPYMAPEQLQGRPADARTDIFAFGLILYELLTGQRPGAQAAPLRDGPPALQHVLDRCLANDPDDRWQSIRDVKSQLEWIATSPAGEPKPARRWIPMAAAACLVLAAALGGFYLARHAPQQASVVRFTIDPPLGQHFSLGAPLWLTPDGQSLLHTTLGAGDMHRRIHHLATGESSELADPPEGQFGPWSPTGDSFLVYGSQRLLRVDGSTGAQVEILRGSLSSAAWALDGSYILGVPGMGLFWAPMSAARKLVVPPPHHGQPRVTQVLPGGRTFLYWLNQPNAMETWMGGIDGRRPKLLLRHPARYSPPGFLLYVEGDALMARPFDAGRAELAGDPRSVISGVARDLPTAQGLFCVSENGVLAFLRDRPLPRATRLEIYSRAGKPVGPIGEPGDYVNPALSPDGRRLAVSVRAASGRRDIWVFDLQQGSRVRLTFESLDNNNPTWSPDGSEIAYSAEYQGHHHLYVRPAPPPARAPNARAANPTSISTRSTGLATANRSCTTAPT